MYVKLVTGLPEPWQQEYQLAFIVAAILLTRSSTLISKSMTSGVFYKHFDPIPNSPVKLFNKVKGHSNNTWHSRVGWVSKVSHELFCSLTSHVNAFGSKKLCFRARKGFQIHLLSNLYYSLKLISLKKQSF